MSNLEPAPSALLAALVALENLKPKAKGVQEVSPGAKLKDSKVFYELEDLALVQMLTLTRSE